MADQNPLRYLILSEPGAAALLATALSRHSHANPSNAQLAFWSAFAELCSLPLSKVGPSEVKIEYDGIDLLALWDQWAIVIEGKTSAASVRCGQLQAYYDRLRPQLGKEGILAGASAIAVIFLTPAEVGKGEFDSLRVDFNDRKLHLDWERLLSTIQNSFSVPQLEQQEEPSSTFLSSLMLVGTGQIRRCGQRSTTTSGHVD